MRGTVARMLRKLADQIAKEDPRIDWRKTYRRLKKNWRTTGARKKAHDTAIPQAQNRH